MIFKDRLYGEININEPVILELLNSPFLKRLDKIDQSGYYNPYVEHISMTRLEHSIGCYFLLKKFGASIEEQINGLIHDVSHTAFSHFSDYILADSGKEQTYQDNIFIDFILKTDIPDILRNYNFDVDYILDEKNFPLQERDIPDLCADRLDYSLRSFIAFGILEKEKVLELINDLTIVNNEWVFKSFNCAQKYADYFKKLNDDHLCGINSAIMFQRASNYFKYALSRNYILEEDLHKTDDYVLGKINIYLNKDPELMVLWDDMNNKHGFEENKNDYEYIIYLKSRVVDPKFIKADDVMRISEVNFEWAKITQKALEPVKYYLKLYVKKN